MRYRYKYNRYKTRKLQAQLASLSDEREFLRKSSGWLKSTTGFCHCRVAYFKITGISDSSTYVTGRVFLMYPRKGVHARPAWIHTRDVLRRWKEIPELEGSAIEAACEL